MRKLFDIDGPVMSALAKLSDLVFCNIMFLVFSLPVITFGASLTALFDCTLAITEDKEEQLIFQQFWRAFRKHFKRATLLWLICLGVIALLVLYAVVVDLLPEGLYRMYRVTFFVILFLFLAGFQYVFPLTARYELRVGETLKRAWTLSVVALPMTLCGLALPAVAFYVSFVMNPDSVNVMFFLWAFVAMAIIAYLNSFLYRRAFKKLPPQ